VNRPVLEAALGLAAAIAAGRRPLDVRDREAVRAERIEALRAAADLLDAVDTLERRARDMEALEDEHRDV
jgi:hypothetical protein